MTTPASLIAVVMAVRGRRQNVTSNGWPLLCQVSGYLDRREIVISAV
jgi:hypothetical protein